MENQQASSAARSAAVAALLGSVCMLVGAAVMSSTGADIDKYLYANDMAGYLKQASASQNSLILNLSLWIAGVILLGAAATLMTMIGGQNPVRVQLVRYNYGIGIPLVVVSYMAWLAVVVRLAASASPEAAAIAEAVGWFGVRADWVATALVIGTGPVLLSAAGKGIWVPGWLRVWSYLCLLAGILTTIAQYTGGLMSYGFLIIPVGMSWMIAAGVVLWRGKFEG